MNQIPRYLGICQISEGSEPLSVSTSHVKERVTPRYQADTDRPDTHQDTPTLRQRHGGQRGRDTPRARQGARAGGSRRAPALPLTRAAAQAAHQSTPYSVLNSAKSECSSVVSLADFWRSPHAVHLARGREDALDARGGGRCGEVLLDHLGKRRPLCLLGFPPREHVELEPTPRTPRGTARAHRAPGSNRRARPPS